MTQADQSEYQWVLSLGYGHLIEIGFANVVASNHHKMVRLNRLIVYFKFSCLERDKLNTTSFDGNQLLSSREAAMILIAAQCFPNQDPERVLEVDRTLLPVDIDDNVIFLDDGSLLISPKEIQEIAGSTQHVYLAASSSG